MKRWAIGTIAAVVGAALLWFHKRAPQDAGPARIVIVIGKKGPGAPGQHEYAAGAMLLARLLSETKRVVPVIARDEDPEATLADARAIAFYCDGGAAHPLADPRWVAAVERAVRAGSGLVFLHDALDVPEEHGERLLRWIGGRFKRGFSSERLPGWPAGFESLPAHPVTRGVSAFGLEEEWQLDHEFLTGREGIQPILRAVPPEYVVASTGLAEQIEAWAFERSDGGRSFAVAAPHYHDSWRSESLRRLVINAVLWTAKIEVPAE